MRRETMTILATALVLASCGKPDEKVTIDTGDTEMTVDAADGGQTKVETVNDKGEKVTMEAGPASTWPDDAPEFAIAMPGGAVIHTIATTEGTKTSRMVMFETTAMTPEEVVNFYKDLTIKAGLGQPSQMGSAGNFIFGARDEATGRTLSLQVASTDGKTAGSLTWVLEATP